MEPEIRQGSSNITFITLQAQIMIKYVVLQAKNGVIIHLENIQEKFLNFLRLNGFTVVSY